MKHTVTPEVIDDLASHHFINFKSKKLEDVEKKLIKSIDPKIISKTVSINGIDLHYVTLGKGEPVILIHGATLGWGQWYANIKPLSQYFKVIAIDLPGAGLSSRVNFQNEDLDTIFTDVVSKCIHKLGIKRTYIVGHSFGGWVAARLAEKNPKLIKKVVLINSVGFAQEIPGKFKILSFLFIANILNKLALGKSLKKTQTFLHSVCTNSDTALNTHFINYFHKARLIPKTQSPFHLISSSIEKGHLKEKYSISSFLRKINIPTMIVWGMKDTSMIYPPILERIENKYIFVHKYHRVGHIPFIEESKKFNNLLLTFLQE